MLDNKLEINFLPRIVNEINKIIETFNELEPEEIKPKRKNSFNCSNIFKNKKQMKNNKIIKNEKNPKKCEETENKIKLILLLENPDNKKNSQRKNSISYKSENNTEKKNKLKSEKYNSLKSEKRSNLNLSSVKTKHLRNFIPKSEILKLNKNKSNLSSLTDIEENKNKVDLLFTKRTKDQDKFNEYHFFNCINDKYNNNNKNINDLKKNIISNTYMDKKEEDNEDFNYQIRNKNENRFNNYNNVINYFGNNIKDLTNNYYKYKDSSNENYSKNINPKTQITNNINNNDFHINEINLNKFVEKIIQDENCKIFPNEIKENNFLKIPNISHKGIYMANNINSNINNNREKEKSLINKYNEINNFNNTICNNYINNSYIFQNQPTYYINYINQYYIHPQIPIYYQNNNNNSFLCHNYNNLNNNNITNNYQYINNHNQCNQFNQNNINTINYINFNDDKLLAKNAFNLSKTQSGCKLLQDKILSRN